jgi:ABC-2 type transport system permease protein
MTAIYKKELRGYLTSMLGYVFAFLILLLIGIYFTAYNINGMYPKFETTLSSTTFVFLIAVPLLSMRILAEERKQKTDQMLLTAPVKIHDIVIGKYLALLTVYLIPMAVICFYPLIMGKYGNVSYPTAYTAVFGFFLLGAALLAVGMFLSSVTESQVIAAVLTFIILFASYVITGISSFIPETAAGSVFIYAVLIAALAILLQVMIQNPLISGIAGVVGEILLFVVYFVKSSILEGSVQKLLTVFDISGHFDNFTNGLLDLQGVVYFLSVIVICLFFTVQSINKRRWN